MKRLITFDDVIETYTKLHQRGFGFIYSKLNTNEVERAKTAFNHVDIQSANWWIIPKVRARWNKLTTGNENIGSEQFTVEKFLNDRTNLTMLSLGSGECSSELLFAEYANFKEITCTDIAEKRLKKGKETAKAKGLTNINFQILNANDDAFPEKKYDIIYFRASLHHFKSIESLVGERIKNILKKDGLLIIDEYVGPTRLQFPKHQIQAINKSIQLIPKTNRKRFKLSWHKNKVSGPGLLRMILADPSECVDSVSILPTIHKNYTTIYEAGYGGNILTLALKDIAHHFVNLNEEKTTILEQLFKFEDAYLKKHASDYVFGIYKPN